MKKLLLLAALALGGCTSGPPQTKVVQAKVTTMSNGFSYFYLIAADGSRLSVESTEYALAEKGDTITSAGW